MATANQGHISGTVWHSGNDGSGSGLDADLLDGVQGSNYARTDISETFAGAITVGASVITNDIKCTGQQLVLSAGESAGQATGQTHEYVYINAEEGLQINASPNNWSSGWGSRVTHTFGKSSSTIATALTVSGAVTATNFVKASDSRLKEGMDDDVLSLATLKKIEPKLYKMKGSGEIQAGVYADQLPEEVAFMTEPIEGGFVGMKYDNLHALSIAAIQEVDEENRALRQEVSALRNEVEELKAMIQKLI